MKKVLLYTALLLVFLSCSKEQGKMLVSGAFDVSLSAELPEMRVLDNNAAEGETRASTQYTVRIKWAAGDKLSVINLTTGKILGGNLRADSGGNITTFSGTLSGTVNDGDVFLVGLFLGVVRDDVLGQGVGGEFRHHDRALILGVGGFSYGQHEAEQGAAFRTVPGADVAVMQPAEHARIVQADA